VFTLVACGDAQQRSSQVTSGPAAPTPDRAGGLVGLIAYQTNRGGHEGIWLIRSDGSSDYEVATDIPDAHLHPDWSPDGQRLLFTKRADKDLLFEADATGNRARQIVDCDDPCAGDDEASYSRDGRMIAFIRVLGPLVNDRPSVCGLWIFDRETRKTKRLTRHRGCRTREAFPRWSPDGQTLLFFRDRSDANGTSKTAVFTRPARGGRERQLTPWKLAAGDPDWSPDGKRIVFSTYPLVYFQSSGVSNLYTMRPDSPGVAG